MVPLAVVVLAFLAYSLPPYLTLDPVQSRVPPPQGLAAYYPLLVAHIAFATVAIVTCLLQIWPWLRRTHMRAHRITGRVYVFTGVLPAGLLALVIGSVSSFGPVMQVSNVLLASLWLACTFAGYRAARQRRFTEHRRWMIRSFVLTLSIVTNRLWMPLVMAILAPQLHTTFGGSEIALGQTIAALSGWLGWTIPLLFTEWWLLERNAQHPRRVGTSRTRVGTSRT